MIKILSFGTTIKQENVKKIKPFIYNHDVVSQQCTKRTK